MEITAKTTAVIALWVAPSAAWVTHIWWAITAPAHGNLGAIGAFMPPVGMIHGVMIWFGAGF